MYPRSDPRGMSKITPVSVREPSVKIVRRNCCITVECDVDLEVRNLFRNMKLLTVDLVFNNHVNKMFLF